ncbi:MAG: hypothetical protein IT385_04500 [Deltaproteobacteria bacterium]|nr:hypothetical protein [Deltaproteobacteria bacterium]
MKTSILKLGALAPMFALPLSGACGIDPLIWGNLTGSDFEAPPPAGTQTVTGVVSELGAGAQVAFWTPAGIPLADLGTTTGDEGAFTAAFPATTAYANTIVVATGGDRLAWGVVPRVPAKTDVNQASVTVTLGTDIVIDGEAEPVALMADLDADATTAVLLLLAKAAYAEPPTTLASLSPEAVIDALGEIEGLLDADDARIAPLHAMVGRLVAGDITTRPALRPFPTSGDSYLDLAALAVGADYDGDELADTSTAAFDAALRNAAASIEFNVCFADDTIRVVLVTNYNQGTKDMNCSTINRFKWLTDWEATGKQMFITGSLHATTPNCDVDEPPCIESARFDAASQSMGNWTPNTVPMYDDGTHGDAVAGDDLWTITFDLPWFDAGSPTARWVRIAYKYTWGTQGALWTGSEEWPGNQRILELRDLTGDRMIVRQDNFGDETTNKDKQNLLAPGRGGCGTVLWQSELNPPPEGRRDNCVDDTLERMIDTDGDCELDAWPTQFSAGPITLPCQDE